MSQNKDIIRLSLAVVISSLILGIGFWGLKMFTQSPQNPPVDTTSLHTGSLDDRMSFGEKILVEKELSSGDKPSFQAFKNRGVEAIRQNNYPQAENNFAQALEIAPNAPETRIYLNNAKIGNADAYTIAVQVPIVPQDNGNEHPANALEMLRGFAHAQEEINQPGNRINGKPVKLLIVDDDDNSEVAKKLAEKLVKDKKIIGVMGHRLSEVSLAVAPIYAKGKLVFITPTSVSADLNRNEFALNSEDNQRYVFRTNTDTEIAGKKLADYIQHTLKVNKVAIFYDSSPKIQYSQNLRKDFLKFFEDKSHGREVVDSIDLSQLSEVSFDKQTVNSVLQKGARAILLLPNIRTRETALNVISATPKTINKTERVHLIGDISILYRSITLSQGEKAEGMVLAVASRLTNKDKFYQDALSLWGGKIDLAWQTTNSYDAAQIFIQALKDIEAQNGNVSREAVQEQICRNGFKATAASGNNIEFDCDRTSTPLDRVKLVQVSPPDASNSDYYFKPLSNSERKVKAQ